jgi:pimeloyl-ACP methyl ester carboxylesterase
MKSHTIQLGNKSVHYIEAGKGPKVILLHGFAEDHRIWKQPVNFLSNHFRVLVPDLPGYGNSDVIEDMSISGMADWLQKFIQHITSNLNASIVLIGHSMGGYITLAYEEKYPASLTGIGLFHSTAFADTEEKKMMRQKSIAFISEHGSYIFLQQSIPNLFAANYRNNHAVMVTEMIENYKDLHPQTLIANYIAMAERVDRTAVLQNFKKPILFIIGREDKAVPFKDSMRLCGMPQLSYIHILGNSAHMGMLEEPEKSCTALLSFLKGTVTEIETST